MPRRSRIGRSASKPTGLVGHWRFDELGGLAFDYSGSANHGHIDGATRVVGQVGGALLLNGTDNSVNCGSDDSLDVFRASGSKLLTVICWIKRTSLDSRTQFVLSRAIASAGYGVRIMSDDILRFTTSGVKDYNFAATITDTDWHHVAFVYDSSYDVSLYLEGAFQEKVTHNVVGSTTASTSFLVGYGPTADTYFNGTTDDIHIYSVALSAEDIEKIYDDTK